MRRVQRASGTLRIEGWRRSHNEVATFRFGRVSDSYAARTTGATKP
jgi:hypothetical protein